MNASGAVLLQPYADKGYASVGIRWDLLPPTAVLRVGLAWAVEENARMVDQAFATALTVYGAQPGQCPPGALARARECLPHV